MQLSERSLAFESVRSKLRALIQSYESNGDYEFAMVLLGIQDGLDQCERREMEQRTA